MGTRIEYDSMGEVEVAADALWGPTTQRALHNLKISSLRLPQSFMSALGVVKVAAARANRHIGALDPERCEAIVQAGLEVIRGTLHNQFVVDLFQTGSGTATNMNANEVIAHRANQMLTHEGDAESKVHPNDHVNMGQSSNDVIPSALHISVYQTIHSTMLPKLRELERALAAKSDEFSEVVKPGRTHLQDATPVTLGQEFGGYASQVCHAIQRIERSSVGLLSLALGGSAVGTGITTRPGYVAAALKEISALTGFHFVEAENHFESQASQDVVVEVSGQLRGLAIVLMKIANDLRWMASGPRCGLGEISLPSIMPGSSIMPGKINPVVCEIVMMVGAHVIGNDAAVSVCGQNGNFELNTMLPLLAHHVLEQIELLGNSSHAFAQSCVSGIVAHPERCRELTERSLASVTALTPEIGYDRAAELVSRAMRENSTVRQVADEAKALPKDQLDKLLDPRTMVGRGASGLTSGT
jgi:fumarate hydratase class II